LWPTLYLISCWPRRHDAVRRTDAIKAVPGQDKPGAECGCDILSNVSNSSAVTDHVLWDALHVRASKHGVGLPGDAHMWAQRSEGHRHELLFTRVHDVRVTRATYSTAVCGMGGGGTGWWNSMRRLQGELGWRHDDTKQI
jgi:hypothetical protein